MQRTTSFEPILCNVCVEETRGFYRNKCDYCENYTCYECFDNDIKEYLNKYICLSCYEEWFNIQESNIKIEIMLIKEILVRCRYCGNIWDGNGECTCYLVTLDNLNENLSDRSNSPLSVCHKID